MSRRLSGSLGSDNRAISPSERMPQGSGELLADKSGHLLEAVGAADVDRRGVDVQHRAGGTGGELPIALAEALEVGDRQRLLERDAAADDAPAQLLRGGV